MFLRALLAFLLLPGFAAVLAPPLIASFDPSRGQLWMPGLALLFAGAVVLLWCVRDFYVSGKGTLAPWDPPKNLVVVGLYRFVRNPMYVGVLLLVAGWSVTLSSPVLIIYTVILAAAFHVRVVSWEEPWLASEFGEAWKEYSSDVSRWLPRMRPRKK